MKVTLIYPPVSTATSTPPCSLAALKAYLAVRGVAVRSRDLNLELFQYLLDGWEGVRPHLEKRLQALYHAATAGPQASAMQRLRHVHLPLIDQLRRDECSREILARLVREVLAGAWFGDILREGYFLRCNYRSLQLAMDRLRKDPVVAGFLGRVTAEPHQLTGFSLLAESQLPFAVLLARWLRCADPRTVTVAGGPYVSELVAAAPSGLDPAIFQEFDFIVFQEGESALEELVRSLETGRTPRHPNLLTTSEPLPRVPLLEPMDVLPSPDFSDLDLGRYFTSDLSLPVYSSKGCSWGRCTFCSQTSLSYRERPVPSFVDGLEEVVRRTGVTHFQFVDENFSPERLGTMSREILNRELAIRWFIQVRFDVGLDRQVLTAMKMAGCYAVEFGLESGCPEILRQIRKGISLRHADRILGDCAALGIEVVLNCMIGFPGEAMEQAEQTVSFLEGVVQRHPDLRLTCNTQFVKIYAASRHATSGRVECCAYPLSTVADWAEPRWLDEFQRRYRTHFIFTGRAAEGGTRGNVAEAEVGPDPTFALSKGCHLIESVEYDFASQRPCDPPRSYMVLTRRESDSEGVFMLNEVMRSLVDELNRGPVRLSQLREGFRRRYETYAPDDVTAAFRDGMMRLNEIGALHVRTASEPRIGPSVIVES